MTREQELRKLIREQHQDKQEDAQRTIDKPGSKYRNTKQKSMGLKTRKWRK